MLRRRTLAQSLARDAAPPVQHGPGGRALHIDCLRQRRASHEDDIPGAQTVLGTGDAVTVRRDDIVVRGIREW